MLCSDFWAFLSAQRYQKHRVHVCSQLCSCAATCAALTNCAWPPALLSIAAAQDVDRAELSSTVIKLISSVASTAPTDDRARDAVWHPPATLTVQASLQDPLGCGTIDLERRQLVHEADAGQGPDAINPRGHQGVEGDPNRQVRNADLSGRPHKAACALTHSHACTALYISLSPQSCCSGAVQRSVGAFLLRAHKPSSPWQPGCITWTA
jgi:hypothetical protein